MHSIFYEAADRVYTVCNEKRKSWDMLGQHYHNGYELYMLAEGERRVWVNGRFHRLKPHELLVIKPYQLHYFQTGTEYFTRYIMNIPSGILNDFLGEAEVSRVRLPSCIITLNDENSDALTAYFLKIKKYSDQGGLPAEKLMICSLVQLLYYLAELHSRGSRDLGADNPIIRPEMQAAVKFIHLNYMNEDLSLNDAAAYIHMSTSRFCELFKKTTGQTFLKYLNLIRVMKAERGLLSTDKSLSRLAEENGFASVAHMTRMFNAVHGMPPSEYRKLKRR